MFTLRPVAGENFVDREELLREMVSELSNPSSRDGFALYGIRRVGKTSVFKEVARRLKEKEGVVPVYFSMWDLTEFTLEEFCRSLSKEVLDEYRPRLGLKFKAAELLSMPLSALRKIASIKVVYEDIEFIASFRGERLDELVERTFQLPEKLAENTGTKCVLMIDEFPEVINLETNGGKTGTRIVKKIRTLCESWERTALCISGSIRSTMELVALSSASPFYRQFVIREVKPLEDRHVIHLLRKNLRIDENAAVEVSRFTGGIPFYVQALGKILSRKGDKEISLEDVLTAEEEFLSEEGDLLFREEFERLSTRERLVLRSIVAGGREVKDLRKKLSERVSNVSAVLRALEDKGVILRKERGRYYVVDPVFEEWLARRAGEKTFTQQVLDALKVPRSMQELYRLFPERPESSVRGTVYRLMNRGLVKRTGKGKYLAISSEGHREQTSNRRGSKKLGGC